MIKVDLSAAEIPIEPGGTAQLTVTATNKQDHDDHVFLEIEGIDVEWYALPVPSFTIPAGESQSARVLFKIARSSASVAGVYPFVVRVRSLESGASGVQQAELVIKPFSALQVDLTPRRAVSTFLRHTSVFEVTISNLGNKEETLDLYASDPDDGCAYEFEASRVTVKPGCSETVPLVVEPVTRPVLGSHRLYAFVVSARSVEDSYVAASAHGQLERRALATPFAAAVLILVCLGAGGWALLRPRPVALNAFQATPMQVKAGEEVTLAWDAVNLAEGVIRPDVGPVNASVGAVKVRPEHTTTYEFVARGGGRQVSKSVTVQVIERPPPRAPQVVQLEATRRRIHQGDAVTLSWKVEGATKIVLNPLGREGEWPLYTSQEVRPDATTTYEIAAKGPGGVARKSLKVEVVPAGESLAEIRWFRAKPELISPGGSAALSWSVENAASVEIEPGVGTGLKPKGRVEVSPEATTTYTLRVSDDRGNPLTRQVVVRVEESPPPESPEPPSGAP